MTSLTVKFLGMSTQDAPLKLAKPGDICVNPLNWTTSEDLVGVQRNLGSVTFASQGGIELNVADAQCSEGSLIVSPVESERFSSNMPFVRAITICMIIVFTI